MLGGDALPASNMVTIAGAAPSASRSMMVERFALIAMLTVMMSAIAAMEPAISPDRNILFDMMLDPPSGRFDVWGKVAEMGLSARTREKDGHYANAGGLSAELRDPLYSNR